MSWATRAIAELQLGKSVTLKPRGRSMIPRVNDGDTVVVAPLEGNPEVGDVVLVRCKGNDYLHLIKACREGQYLIGNNRGGTNGWVSRHSIYGIARL